MEDLMKKHYTPKPPRPEFKWTEFIDDEFAPNDDVTQSIGHIARTVRLVALPIFAPFTTTITAIGAGVGNKLRGQKFWDGFKKLMPHPKQDIHSAWLTTKAIPQFLLALPITAVRYGVYKLRHNVVTEFFLGRKGEKGEKTEPGIVSIFFGKCKEFVVNIFDWFSSLPTVGKALTAGLASASLITAYAFFSIALQNPAVLAPIFQAVANIVNAFVGLINTIATLISKVPIPGG